LCGNRDGRQEQQREDRGASVHVALCTWKRLRFDVARDARSDAPVTGRINSVSGPQRFAGNSLANFSAPIREPPTWVLAFSGVAIVL